MITFYTYIWQVFIHGIFLYVDKVRLNILPLRLIFVIINKLNFVYSWFSFAEIVLYQMKESVFIINLLCQL